MIIKLLLVACLGAAALYQLRGRRSALSLLMRRTLTLGIVALGILAVLAPGLVTEAAHAVGVGRGADLLLYVLCVAFLFVTIGLHMRIGQLEERLVELARSHALLEASLRDRRDQDAGGAGTG